MFEVIQAILSMINNHQLSIFTKEALHVYPFMKKFGHHHGNFTKSSRDFPERYVHSGE